MWSGLMLIRWVWYFCRFSFVIQFSVYLLQCIWYEWLCLLVIHILSWCYSIDSAVLPLERVKREGGRIKEGKWKWICTQLSHHYPLNLLLVLCCVSSLESLLNLELYEWCASCVCILLKHNNAPIVSNEYAQSLCRNIKLSYWWLKLSQPCLFEFVE